ncbi:MAG: hypothetical protein ABIR70_07940 [Bryobacteraceae bacterium]
MSQNPRPTGKELVSALQKVGFSVVRIRGSYHTVGPGLLHKILRDCDLTILRLVDLL